MKLFAKVTIYEREENKMVYNNTIEGNVIKKSSIIVLLLAFCLIFFGGCVSSNNDSAEREYHTVTDMAGNEVKLPVNIERISCMSATCETALVAMGQAEKMICTSAFASGDFSFTYKVFPELENVEKVKGGLSDEELIARGVDVVFVKSKSNVDKLKEAGITPFYLEFNNIEQTKESISLLGEIFNVPNIADAYIGYIDEYLPMIQERLADIPDEDKITVYAPLLRGSDNTIFNTYDPSHISTEMFDSCGAHVITQDIEFTDNNGIITEEALIRLNPDVIMVCGFYREQGVEYLTDGKYDDILDAVKNKKIYYYPLGMYDWSAGGFELGISSLWTAKTLYPEYFEDIDLVAVTKEYYKNTTGASLTDEDIAYIFESN